MSDRNYLSFTGLSVTGTLSASGNITALSGSNGISIGAGDDGEEISQQWGVDFSKLVPVLVAELKALRARVAQLENKA